MAEKSFSMSAEQEPAIGQLTFRIRAADWMVAVRRCQRQRQRQHRRSVSAAWQRRRGQCVSRRRAADAKRRTRTDSAAMRAEPSRARRTAEIGQSNGTMTGVWPKDN